MTDNRTTEKLRKLLEERGVEWKSGRTNENNTSWDVGDLRVTAKELSDGTLLMQQYSRKHFTPEQAIAATLGSGTCELIDTTSPGNDDYWNSAKCSECGVEFTCAIFGRSSDMPDADYCPSCGRKVVRQ